MLRYPCPCCGRLVHTSAPGSYSICPVCGWEDDVVQLRWPQLTGANRTSLIDAQRLYAEHGYSKEPFSSRARTANDEEPLDEGFRPLDLQTDNFETPDETTTDWPGDRTQLYWWRPSYWRADD
ncbi:CPCC family cysteine-rich protein [Kribbella sp. NPDC051770]|uniref:CPCC family cysteine-rich protein n=1 Tax=Kribbella sp. NPDC051770 TaxID=3155413 RepID=UPI0034386DB8